MLNRHDSLGGERRSAGAQHQVRLSRERFRQQASTHSERPAAQLHRPWHAVCTPASAHASRIWPRQDGGLIGGTIARSGANKAYHLNQVFNGASTTEEVYVSTTQSLVRSVVDGFNCTVFAYGQTSSGKTHTMRGTSEDEGIIGRAIADLFDSIRCQAADKDFSVRCSYMEVRCCVTAEHDAHQHAPLFRCSPCARHSCASSMPACMPSDVVCAHNKDSGSQSACTSPHPCLNIMQTCTSHQMRQQLVRLLAALQRGGQRPHQAREQEPQDQRR